MALHGMLIYEIVRHIVDHFCNTYKLSCTFPSGNRHISVVLGFSQDQLTEVQKFKLDPETSIQIVVVLTQKER